MADASTGGWIGGAIGAVLGVLGGAYGTWRSIRQTSGPRERSFVLRVAVTAWLLITLFLLGLVLVPLPYRPVLWIPYVVALPLAVRWANRRQARLRAEEAADTAQVTDPRA